MKRTLQGMLVLGISLLSGSWALAADAAPRLITVTGEAEVLVAPDRAVITLGVETWNKDLDKAHQENNERVQTTLSQLKQSQIPAEDIQTGFFSLEPTYETQYDQHSNPTKQVLTGYKVNKTMTVTVKDLNKFEKVFSAVQKNGANHVGGLEFKSSELRKYRDQARAQAIRAAQEKASALAKEIGQSIGKACSISEERTQPWYPRGQAQNVMQNISGGGNTAEETLAPGKISISAQISVSFELL